MRDSNPSGENSQWLFEFSLLVRPCRSLANVWLGENRVPPAHHSFAKMGHPHHGKSRSFDRLCIFENGRKRYFCYIKCMRSIRTKLKGLERPLSNSSKLSCLVEKRHIQAHLALTELRLRLRSAQNKDTQQNREAALNILHDYWKNGLFPKNTYKTHERTPVFIDEDNIHCAVGYLMAQTGYALLAQQINNSNRFVLVENLQKPEAERWLMKYGIGRQEAALIQPGYGGYTLERVSYSLHDKILSVVTLLASLAILTFAIAALWLIRNKTISRRKKHTYLQRMAIATIAIIIGIVLFLPTPKQAIQGLVPYMVVEDRIECGGWNSTLEEQHDACKEYEKKGSARGWRPALCDFCID